MSVARNGAKGLVFCVRRRAKPDTFSRCHGAGCYSTESAATPRCSLRGRIGIYCTDGSICLALERWWIAVSTRFKTSCNWIVVLPSFSRHFSSVSVRGVRLPEGEGIYLLLENIVPLPPLAAMVFRCCPCFGCCCSQSKLNQRNRKRSCMRTSRGHT